MDKEGRIWGTQGLVDMCPKALVGLRGKALRWGRVGENLEAAGVPLVGKTMP